ncbi:PAS domain S-box protein [Halobaculum sp. CBA1158]|uniref:PAS domain S-box protein n=1 Tax=Halobaculum sp. CBA1158 TaxID=2904243 RepID=UPI001F23F2BD|nr:PAS domain S-box protein [Halobaculum sp. CBA1158]UIO99696.1 PAS domain S-box protein [Halobaculum sp. CBA1158]
MADPIRVLHVDDDPDFADLTAAFLERTDDRFSVETAKNAEEALERLDDGIDCVVSDYDMPGTDGIELLETVRERDPDLPFVLFTGKGSEEIASEAISAGVTDYLQKKGGQDGYEILANRVRNAVERARAERRADLWARAVETANEGISIIDGDGRFVEVNESYAANYGVEPAELIGRHWTETVPDEEAERLREEVFPTLEGDTTWVGDSIGERVDGSTYPKLLSLAPLSGGGHVCVIRDVSQRRDRERERRRKAAELDALFENSPAMIDVHDDEGRILDVNRRFCETLGYDEDELIGRRVWELDDRIDPETVQAMWDEMNPGETRRLEGTYRHSDGRAVPAEVTLSQVDIAGESRFFVISRDLSNVREREYERAILERGVEQIEAGVGAYDEHGEVVFVNDYYPRLLGGTRSDLEGAHIWDVNPEIDADRFDEYWDSYDVGETRVHETVNRRMDTGEDVPVRTTTTRVRVDGDDYHVGTISDITDQKRREERLERKIERLDEFASIVSHDLRNPLNVATGRLRLARAEADSPHLEDVESALDRMDELIDDLLVLAREGDEVAEREPVDVAAFVEACWGTVDTREASLQVDTDLTVSADESRLRQLVENLLRNAVDHGGPAPTITVGDCDGGVYVADDGPGIDPERREEVFDAGVSTAENGTGFGLSIVEEIAEAHGWSVRVTDAEGGGARFEITGVDSPTE